MNTYEKKYEEALKRAKKLYEQGTITESLSYVFPELAESGDEKIRKEIIKFLIDVNNGAYTKSELEIASWIAWLEKPQKTPSEMLEEYFANTPKEQIDKNWEELKHLNDIGPIIETVNKSKFNEGDFIKHNKANIICKVISVNSGSYYVENIETSGRIELFNAEQNFHLWTIQDAKDGDVLALDWKDEQWQWQKIVIFKSLNEYGVEGYGITLKNNKLAFEEDILYYSQTWSKYLHPANKNQRDLLFQKIKESGYVWDSEKKELMKMEQKSTELPKGEDYGIDGLWNAIRILEKTLGKVEGYQTDDGILEHECAINAVKELYEQKPTWSEEDTFKVQRICKYLDEAKKYYADITEIKECMDWLKSLIH